MDNIKTTDNGNNPVIEDMFSKTNGEDASVQLDDDMTSETDGEDTVQESSPEASDLPEDDMTIETDSEAEESSDETSVLPDDPLVALEERYNSGDPLSGLDIPSSTSMIAMCSAANNRNYNNSMEDFCRNAIYTGAANNELKLKLRKEKKGTWKAHAKEYFSGISIRTMQKQMKLGKFDGILNHTRFGFEALYVFVSWLEGRKSKDPIGDFLNEFPFEVSLDEYLPVREIKLHVQAGLIVEKARDVKFELELDDAKELVKNDIQIDFDQAKELIDATGGDPKTYIRSEIEKGSGIKVRGKKAVSLKAIASQLHNVISEFIDEDTIVDDVEPVELGKLISDLDTYKGMLEDEL